MENETGALACSNQIFINQINRKHKNDYKIQLNSFEVTFHSFLVIHLRQSQLRVL